MSFPILPMQSRAITKLNIRVPVPTAILLSTSVQVRDAQKDHYQLTLATGSDLAAEQNMSIRDEN